MDAEINSRLYHKSQSLMANNAYMKKGATIAEKVIQLLKQMSGFSVNRFIHSVTSGKKTTIPYADFEIVVFVNEQEPPFQMMLLSFEKTLKENGAIYDINIDEIQRSPFSLKIDVDGFIFYLYPASNLVVTKGFLAVEEQLKKTLDKVKKNPSRNGHLYNSALVETRLIFFDAQPSFVTEMVRLAKYWYRMTVDRDTFIAGDKYLIELLMVSAAKAETKKNYIECFQNFLGLLKNFEKLDIIFEEVKIGGHKIPKDIKEEVPLVLDPSNPYNNLAKHWDTMNIMMIKSKAAAAEQRIAKYGQDDPIDKIFQ